MIENDRARQQVARLLRDVGRGLVFSDDPAVRVLSRLGPDRFVRTIDLPLFPREPEAFLQSLRRRGVTHLVTTQVENSLPARFPAEVAPGLTLLRREPASFESDVALYRLEPVAD